jgi:hypothetical protein
MIIAPGLSDVSLVSRVQPEEVKNPEEVKKRVDGIPVST